MDEAGANSLLVLEVIHPDIPTRWGVGERLVWRANRIQKLVKKSLTLFQPIEISSISSTLIRRKLCHCFGQKKGISHGIWSKRNRCIALTRSIHTCNSLSHGAEETWNYLDNDHI
jgi:hypothetical protein